ncbi:unnamed protein product [Camellia sinensis]
MLMPTWTQWVVSLTLMLLIHGPSCDVRCLALAISPQPKYAHWIGLGPSSKLGPSPCLAHIYRVQWAWTMQGAQPSPGHAPVILTPFFNYIPLIE